MRWGEGAWHESKWLESGGELAGSGSQVRQDFKASPEVMQPNLDSVWIS